MVQGYAPRRRSGPSAWSCYMSLSSGPLDTNPLVPSIIPPDPVSTTKHTWFVNSMLTLATSLRRLPQGLPVRHPHQGGVPKDLPAILPLR